MKTTTTTLFHASDLHGFKVRFVKIIQGNSRTYRIEATSGGGMWKEIHHSDLRKFGGWDNFIERCLSCGLEK